MKWNRELHAQMIDAKFSDISDEKVTIKWVARGLSNDIQYRQLERSRKASVPPASLSDIRAILANEEVEVERSRRMDDQL